MSAVSKVAFGVTLSFACSGMYYNHYYDVTQKERRRSNVHFDIERNSAKLEQRRRNKELQDAQLALQSALKELKQEP